MNHTELMIAAGGGLFAAFLLGWLAGWLAIRAGEPALRTVSAPHLVAQPLTLGADDRLTAAERDVTTARDELHEARIEIEELRSYIDRKLGQKADAPPTP